MPQSLARRHPIAMFIVVLVLSPYIAAALLLYVVAYVLAVAIDAAFGWHRR